MTTAPAAPARQDRTPQPQRVEGALFVDMENFRARYECMRPGCPHRLEGPVYATDRNADGERLGKEGLAAWIGSAKNNHLAQHHGSPR